MGGNFESSGFPKRWTNCWIFKKRACDDSELVRMKNWKGSVNLAKWETLQVKVLTVEGTVCLRCY